MKPVLLKMVALLIFHLSAFSQSGKITGIILDKKDGHPLVHATIILRDLKDTIIARQYSNEKGSFSIANLSQNSYTLNIAILGYEPLRLTVSVKRNDSITNLGPLQLNTQTYNLATVEITAHKPPINVKKDTVEFNTDYFNVSEYTSLEDLLKRLPGMQIGSDGIIRMNGKQVAKVFIDGHSYFGDDTKVAIRNLTADLIEQIQVIDRKSNESLNTVATNDMKEKIINIKIKEKWKNRVIGKTELGYGNDNRYSFKAGLNSFAAARQLALIGGTNNIGAEEDRKVNSNNEGTIRTWNGGLNFSQNINKKVQLRSSFIRNDSYINNEYISERRNLLPDSFYYSNRNGRTNNNLSTNVANLQLEYRPDSSNTLILRNNFVAINRKNEESTTYGTSDDKRNQVSHGSLNNVTRNNSNNIFVSAYFTHLFKRTGRSLKAGIDITNDVDRQTNFLRSQSQYRQTNGEVTFDTIMQEAKMKKISRRTHLSVIYSDRIFKDQYIETSYNYTYGYSPFDKFTYDFNPNKGTFSDLNDSLTNSMESKSSVHTGSVIFRTLKSKYEYGIGSNIYRGSLNNMIMLPLPPIKKDFLSIYPSFSFNYNFSEYNSLRFYSTIDFRMPDVHQLQPVRDNSNPLFLQEGNPDLKLTKTYSVTLGYIAFNPIAMRNFSNNFSLSIFKDKIIYASRVDSLGRQVSSPINTDGSYNLGYNMVNSIPLKRLNTFLNLFTNINFNKEIIISNGQRGATHQLTASHEVSFNYRFKKAFDITSTASVEYNRIYYPKQFDNNSTNYLQFAYTLDATFNLPFATAFSPYLGYKGRSGLSKGYNDGVFILNAVVSKTISGIGQVKLQCFDLLNKNLSVTRNIGDNYTEDLRTNILRRFYLLSFTFFIQ